MSEYRVSDRLALFPTSTRIQAESWPERLVIAGCDLGKLAEQYGTPLYLYDQATMDEAVRAYQQALATFYPGEWGITYAGKAFLCVAMAQWVHRRGLWLDCTGVGELAAATAARVPRSQILVHGVNKSQEDLAASLDLAGTIVVDNLAELDRLVDLARKAKHPLPNLWLRLRPGLAVATHAYTQTGQEDSKFGMNQTEALEAARICCRHGLSLTGLHFHLGSQFRDPTPIGLAVDRTLDLTVTLQAESNWSPQVLCLGGGWGVAYHEDELPHPPIEEYVQYVAGRLAEGCQRRGLPLPHLRLEPGRSLVAQAGVALYRVGAIKQTTNRHWLMLDGGMVDNPRPALYGIRYSALPVQEPGRPSAGPTWLAGPYCESSDVIIEELPLPAVQAGELIAVPMSGAYHVSMSSNYNGACRPAVTWLQNGTAQLARRREEPTDLVRKDLSIEILEDLQVKEA
jgi:diaminopimelate decarboxylase